MASSKKSAGSGRFDKGVIGRRSSKQKEAPVGESDLSFMFVLFVMNDVSSEPAPNILSIPC